MWQIERHLLNRFRCLGVAELEIEVLVIVSDLVLSALGPLRTICLVDRPPPRNRGIQLAPVTCAQSKDRVHHELIL